MESIIEVKNISKKYNIGARQGNYIALRDVLSSFIKRPWQIFSKIKKRKKEEFWALKDINFTVDKGEVVGIIGANGAGKSTLLKILSQITPPTAGEIKIKGRVASLLEVGTGFHPELTGRENIFLNGAILGMTKSEINKKFDEITEFSGIEKFLDTPVKYYSSGMFVRLAFSVAAHMDPEILLVDEVLAVGDAEFQKKCLGKMDEVTKKAGRTILFVSHNMAAIQSLCKRCILLEGGRVSLIGKADVVTKKYLNKEYINLKNNDLFPLRVNDIAIENFSISQYGTETNNIYGGDSFKIKIIFQIFNDIDLFRLGVYINNSVGEVITRIFLSDWNSKLEKFKKGKYKIILEFPANLLMQGNYFIFLHAGRYGIINYLLKYNINRMITISKPSHFNEAHADEVFQSNIIIKREWKLINLKKE
jgi:lipopolysaccharide transport system ATP-binding protein